MHEREGAAVPLSDADYRALAAFRTELRRFLAFSEAAARSAGLPAQQHQALLAIRGHPGPEPASVTDVAEALLLRRHSATELLARVEAAGLIARSTDPGDRRRTLVALTPEGEEVLAGLSTQHAVELRALRAVVADLSVLDRDDR
jgi:DNA-binding MarR family transcriptional regulator